MAKLRLTREATIGGVEVSRFPLILHEDNSVCWIALEYFLDLRRQGVAVSSISTYGAHLSDLVSQLEVDSRDFSEISDEWLSAYRQALSVRKAGEEGRQNTQNYVSQVLRTVVNFLYWQEVNRYVHGVVGKTKDHPVRIVQGVSGGIRHSLVRKVDSRERRSNTPRGEWINIVKGFGPQCVHLAERFELMIDWGVSLGLRAKEICYLTIDQLPVIESVDKALEEGGDLHIKILVSKGGKQKLVPVSPLLLKKTWQYVQCARREIVNKQIKLAKRQYKVFHDPGWLFLSDATGNILSPRSFSNAVRSAFRAAVEAGELSSEQRVWVHGLRHNFAVKLLRKLDEKGVKHPEAIARQLTRHGSEDAMQPYLIDRFNDSFNG